MASRSIKIACAAALLAPLAFVSPASAWTGPAENDCNEPYGAITDDPSPNRDCVGLDLKDGDDPNFPNPNPNPNPTNQTYLVQGNLATSTDIGDPAVTLASCDPGDSAVSGGAAETGDVNWTGPGDPQIQFTGSNPTGFGGTFESNVAATPATAQAFVFCLDNAGPAHVF